MSKVTAIKGNAVRQQVQPQPVKQPKQINLSDLPDGEYRVVGLEKFAVKTDGQLDLFDVYTLMGSNGESYRGGVADKKYRFKPESQIIKPGMAILPTK